MGIHVFPHFRGSCGRLPEAGGCNCHRSPGRHHSSIVVPIGSLQGENGINFSARDGAGVLDGANTRLRLGVAPCVELLVDLPTYFAAVRGSATWGFSDVAPAVKWQISPVPGKVDLSAVIGVALPTARPILPGAARSLICSFRGRGNCMMAGASAEWSRSSSARRNLFFGSAKVGIRIGWLLVTNVR